MSLPSYDCLWLLDGDIHSEGKDGKKWDCEHAWHSINMPRFTKPCWTHYTTFEIVINSLGLDWVSILMLKLKNYQPQFKYLKVMFMTDGKMHRHQDVLDRWDEEGAESKTKLSIYSSNFHLCSWALERDQENEITVTSGRNKVGKRSLEIRSRKLLLCQRSQ